MFLILFTSEMIPDGNYNAVSPQAWAAACCFVQAVSSKIPSQGDDESQVLLARLPCDKYRPLRRCQERIRAGRDAVVGRVGREGGGGFNQRIKQSSNDIRAGQLACYWVSIQCYSNWYFWN